ncbi:glycosyltransferase family protein [Isoptericola sediminis]|nr:glycosyltransferase [Isoptericola sediminis]
MVLPQPFARRKTQVAVLLAVMCGVAAVLVRAAYPPLAILLGLVAGALGLVAMNRIATLTAHRIRAFDQKLNLIVRNQRDIAGTVGRSAPIIRSIAAHRHESVKPSGDKPLTTKSNPNKFASILEEATALAPVTRERPRWKELRVATILDEFSSSAFAAEWTQRPIGRESWRRDLDEFGPDLLFVESAWHGNGRDWSFQLVGPTAPRREIVDLVAECRRRGIPTVFWNKEDPVHFEEFLDAARLFDVVLTSDGNMVDAYRRELGHDRVHLLQFAAQTAIHNPIRDPKLRHKRDVAFGGMYFAHTHEARREQLDLLLRAAEKASAKMAAGGLDIFSRQHGGNERYQFPKPFDARVVGGLPYEKMIGAYRLYKVFLNVNTIVDSPTMCARRVFEITASGTPVVSTPSPALEATFADDEIAQVHTEEEATWTLRHLVRNKTERDRMVHRGQRRIWAHHTYSHRVSEIADRAGVHRVAGRPALPRDRTISVLAPTIRQAQLDHILSTFARQKNVDAELLVMTHGFEVGERDFKEACNRHGVDNARLFSAAASQTLGSCLNTLIDDAEGQVLAKMDDDDFYGDHYLADQVAAMFYSGAELVGKEAVYLYLEAQNVTLLRSPEREHRFTEFVAGPTLVADADLLRRYRFADVTRGEDSRLLRALKADGVHVYSSDRFNFAQFRSMNGDGHTWNVRDLELLAGSNIAGHGWLVDEVSC